MHRHGFQYGSASPQYLCWAHSKSIFHCISTRVPQNLFKGASDLAPLLHPGITAQHAFVSRRRHAGQTRKQLQQEPQCCSPSQSAQHTPSWKQMWGVVLPGCSWTTNWGTSHGESTGMEVTPLHSDKLRLLQPGSTCKLHAPVKLLTEVREIDWGRGGTLPQVPAASLQPLGSPCCGR